MKKFQLLFFTCIFFSITYAQPISLHPKNPHYFNYKGKPFVLITSAEHYGAVINSAFDYKSYFNVLQKHRFNLTRIFVGSYVEGTVLDFVPGMKTTEDENQNTLAVRREKLIAPWARSSTAGYINGGNKFDLDKWDSNYFQRLKDFCAQAAQKNIIVEVVLFSANYGPAIWNNSPLNTKNNTNNTEDIAYNEFHLLKNEKLVARQKAMVRKIVTELNSFDNVFFEICNEPYWLKGIPEAEPTIKVQQFLPEIDTWEKIISDEIKDAEKSLPKKHLVAQNFANTYYKIENKDPNVSILNFHYAYPPKTITDNYQWNNPVAFDETADGQDAPNRRREAWAFIMNGGAVYNNLDWSFTTDDISGLGRNVAGKRQSGKEVRDQLTILAKTINSFDFINAAPLNNSFYKNLPEEFALYGIGITRKDYLVYYIKNKPAKNSSVTLALPTGKYSLNWIDPIDGRMIKQSTITAMGAATNIDLPVFADDLLLRITALK